MPEDMVLALAAQLYKPVGPVPHAGAGQATDVSVSYVNKICFPVIHPFSSNSKPEERQDLYRRQCKMSSYKKLICKGTLRQVFV
jgi:hypothetical protein